MHIRIHSTILTNDQFTALMTTVVKRLDTLETKMESDGDTTARTEYVHLSDAYWELMHAYEAFDALKEAGITQ